MKVINALLNILTALVAVAGVVYLVATYGENIVAWAKKLAGKCSCKCEGKQDAAPEEGKCCCQNAETPEEPAKAEEPAEAEEAEAPAEPEAPAEAEEPQEPAEPEEPAEPAEPAEPEEVVAEDADFEG